MEGKVLGVRGWVAVSAALLFAAGAGAGYFAAISGLGDADGDPVFAEPIQSDSGLHVTNSEVYDGLGLGPEQRSQADRILSEHFQRIRRLREEREALGSKVESDLLALLDEGQREKMRDFLRQIKIHEVAGMVTERLAMYKRQLNLGTREEDMLYQVLLTHQLDRDEAIRKLMEKRRCGEKVARGEFGKVFASAQEDLLAKVKPILSEEQFSHFKEIEKRWQQGWGRGAGGSHRQPASQGARKSTGAPAQGSSPAQDSAPQQASPAPTVPASTGPASAKGI
jgi:hypothetical protein